MLVSGIAIGGGLIPLSLLLLLLLLGCVVLFLLFYSVMFYFVILLYSEGKREGKIEERGE